jgi:general secretion pathway protein K
MTARADAQRGFVLVTVLWMIALLSALAMAASVTFRGFTGIVALDRDRVQVEALLTGGLEAAVRSVAGLGETPIDQIETRTVLSTGSVSAQLSDEGGRIDIGKAPVEVLAGLFRMVGAPAREADAIAQTIAELRQPADGNRANVPPGSQNGGGGETTRELVFTDVRQLARVPGMAPEWVAAVAPLATVYGSESVNPLTAPAEVLAALPGGDMQRASAFVQRRRELAADAARLASILGTPQKYLDVTSHSIVSVRLVARTTNGFTQGAHAVIVMVPKDLSPYRVLAWSPLPSWRLE